MLEATDYIWIATALSVVLSLAYAVWGPSRSFAQQEHDAQVARDTDQFMLRNRQEIQLNEQRTRAEDMWRGKRD